MHPVDEIGRLEFFSGIFGFFLYSKLFFGYLCPGKF